MNKLKKLVIFSSGFGSNLQSIINKLHGHKGIVVKLVVSDKPSMSIKRAVKSGISCLFFPFNKEQNKNEYDCILSKLVNVFNPDLLILSGFMHIFSHQFVANYPNKIINIHPSLLPKYKGLNTHRRVLENGDKIHGTTVHFVNKKLDSGKIIAQKIINVSDNETVNSLENKVKIIENNFYPNVIKNLCNKI